MRRYSRLLSVEERKHKRRAFVYGFLSLLLLLAFIFYGLPSVAKLSTLLADLRPKEQEEQDKNVPAKPRLLTQFTATNSATLTIVGIDQAGVEVIIFQNGKDLGSVKTNETGSFEKEIRLSEGSNKFVTRAKNEKGTESENSETLEIILDTIPPEITITEPTGTDFTEENIAIKGNVDEEAEVYINDKIALTDDQNNFSQSVTLTSGGNKITVRAVDKAGNQTLEELTFNRS